MRSVDLNALEAEYDDADPDGYRAGMARFGERLGAVMIGGTVYELPPGQSNCPYHYEYGNEEWLIVLQGRLTVRHPGGEEQLRAIVQQSAEMYLVTYDRLTREQIELWTAPIRST